MDNKIRPLILFLLVFITFISSCRIEKRLYSSGYYINVNKGKQHAPKTVSKDESANLSSKEIKSNKLPANETTKENEPIIASESSSLYLQQDSYSQKEIQQNKSENYITIDDYKTEFKKGVKKIKSHQKVAGSSMNGMAIAGFVCSMVGLILFGIILGLLAIILSAIGLHRINQDPINWDGKGLAIAGIIIGILDIVGWIFLLLFIL
jgi:hypothetical protein